MLQKDEELRAIKQAMDPSIPKYIFTASVRHHAERCLTALGIDDLFVDIIDIKQCNLNSKHFEHAFQTAMKIAGVDDPESCPFFTTVSRISMQHAKWSGEAFSSVVLEGILVRQLNRGTLNTRLIGSMIFPKSYQLPELFP
jgi:hypothetical protein